MTTLTLHYAPTTCATVTLIALEASGHPFEVKLVQMMKGAHRKPDYLAMSPAGKVPVLVVDGKPMTENVAILAWLAGRFPEAQLLPDPGDFRGRIEVLADLAYCAATLQPFSPRIRMPERICATDPERVRTQAIEQLRLQLDWIEARLGASESGWWYGARWSLVDAHLGWFFRGVTRPPGLDASLYPNLSRHGAEWLARPAVQRAVAREQAALVELGW